MNVLPCRYLHFNGFLITGQILVGGGTSREPVNSNQAGSLNATIAILYHATSHPIGLGRNFDINIKASQNGREECS